MGSHYYKKSQVNHCHVSSPVVTQNRLWKYDKKKISGFHAVEYCQISAFLPI